MKDKLNKFLTIIGLIVLIILSITIYNIAFATEIVNTNLGLVGASGTTVVQEFVNEGIPVEDGDALAESMNPRNFDAYTFLVQRDNLFCVRHDEAIPVDPTYLSRDHMSDVPISDYITHIYDQQPTISQDKFPDYMQNGESGEQITKSNIQWKVYSNTNMKQVSTPYQSFNTNVFAYAATFSLKHVHNGSTIQGSPNYYGKERGQKAIWGETGKWSSSSDQAEQRSETVYKAGKALDEYDTEVANHGKDPTVSVGEKAGTILLGNNNGNYQYKIGPFSMDDYAYAYSSDASAIYSEKSGGSFSDGLLGGIVEGKLILNNGTEIAIDGSSCQIVYTTTGDNNRSGTYFTTPADYKFPWPNSTFYIVVNKSLCGSATTLNNIKFKYQSTRVEGEGWVISGKFVQTKWTRTDIYDSSCTYYCEGYHDGHSCTASSNEHNSGYSRNHHMWCDSSTNYCEHDVWDGHHTWSCDKCQCDGRDQWEDHYWWCSDDCSYDHGHWECWHDHEYCSTGYCSGNSSVHEDGYHGTHTTTFYCSHDHSYCKSFNWKANMTVELGQPMLAVKESKVIIEQTEIETFVDVRLTTDITIDKYISKVEHTGETGLTYGENDDRFELPISTKSADTVKVERGDKVTFKIVLENHQDEEAKVKIRDILPNNDGYTFTPNIDASWVAVPANSQKIIIATVIANNLTGTEFNTALIITRNQGNTETSSNATNSVDYPRTTDREGPVVNVAELNGGKLEDADYYTVKEYNISIDKNIVEVMHLSNSEIVYSGEGRKNIDEGTKQNNPVYVEYGDKVTYEIDVYNTCAPYVPDRTVAPYWEPDKAFVTIEDTLPAKYTDLNVSVVNGSGTVTQQSGKFTISDVEVPAGGTIKVRVSLVVDEHDKTVQEVNTADITGKVYNINKYEVNNNSSKSTSSDYYHINDYNISVKKYIGTYNDIVTVSNNNDNLTSEENQLSDRYAMTEQEKFDRPLQVEQNENIIYSIRLNNNAVAEEKGIPSGVKRATDVRPTTITETLQTGLKYEPNTAFAKVYKADGSDKYNATIPVTETNVGNNTYKFTIPNTLNDGTIIILEPGEYLIYNIPVDIEESNMYLHRLSNTAAITTLTNINNTDDISRVVKNDDYDENIAADGNKTSSDYVKLKDLVIAGKVWLDSDKDGYIGKNASGNISGTIDAAADDLSRNIPAPTGDAEKAMKNIVVRLYSVGTGAGGTDELVRKTKTDANGLFTFGRMEDGTTYYDGIYSYEGGATESEQRIDKATNKDANNNYTANSTLIDYYIEYEYDGVVYKSTEIYSGRDNLDDNGHIIGDAYDDSYNLTSEGIYRIDSNATEFEEERRAFNEKYEIVSLDKAYNEDKTKTDDLEYTKDGHIAWLIQDNERGKEAEDGTGIMTSRSFLKYVGDNQITEYLWLFEQTDNYLYPETDYLKYINLGLEEREDVDISITHDVYEVKTTVNGDEMTYEYNQNDFTLGNSHIDKAQASGEISEKYDSKFYMTGYEHNEDLDGDGTIEGDDSELTPYDFKIYNSDYNYNVNDYDIQTIRDYKGPESELNIQTTFRIKVTNNSFTEDEPHLANKDIKVYTGINEIVEYYDKDLLDIVADGTGTVNEIIIKTKDADGYLVNTPIKVGNVEYVMQDGTRKEAVLSTSSKYSANLSSSDYNAVYITPKVADGVTPLAGDIILAEGESVDVLITFIIDKNSDDYKNLKTLYPDGMEIVNVAELSAYSTYYKDVDGSYYAAGLVDANSNPGNAASDIDNIELYEDDTFKTGINMALQPLDKERFLTGFVWDDARTDTAADEKGVQYIGDGKYDTGVNAVTEQPEARRNEKVSNNEETDIPIEDMNTMLVEIIAVPERDASGAVTKEKLYEQTIVVNDDSKMSVRTDGSGKYSLQGYIPGNYVVKFFYGDKPTGNMLIFNGQDYKSTTYQAGEANYAENIPDPDQRLVLLEKENISDARDDEIKRLEAISYSETIDNGLTEILRASTAENAALLVANTDMESETAEFLVRTEEEAPDKRLTYQETMDKFAAAIRFDIVNIDFGVQYRPEHQVALSKYISNVRITTSDTNGEATSEPLVDAIFDEYYGVVVSTNMETGTTEFLKGDDGNIIAVGRYATNAEVEAAISAAIADAGDVANAIASCETTENGLYIITLAGTKLNTDKSIGLSNLQYVENEYDPARQGFVYVNVDNEIMQGATIAIKYVFGANNLSEIDRVSSNLSVLRFEENDGTAPYKGTPGKYYEQVRYQLGLTDSLIKIDYSGADTASNELFSEYYEYELDDSGAVKQKITSDVSTINTGNNDIIYRVKDKNMRVDGTSGKIISTIDDVKHTSEDTTYYGRYLGSVYYTGKIGDDDVVAELKIDKILDYVDNDLVFDNTKNNGENNLWKTTTSKELFDSGLISEISFRDLTGTPDAGLVSGNKVLLDSKERAYDTTERSNLAVLLDDRVKDYANPADDITVNKDISKYLKPRYSIGAESFGTVNLIASKVISAQESTEDMTYENIGEIIQYSSVVGRVTTLATTLGNVRFFDPDPSDPTSDPVPVEEWKASLRESDTSATEQITLTPPTGLGKVQQIIRDTVEGASYTVIIIIAVTVVCVAVAGGIAIYRKRRIK